jgi:hypothetical protein
MRNTIAVLFILATQALCAQSDTRVAKHLEAFYKVLTATTEYRLEVSIAHGNGRQAATNHPQKGLVMRRGDDLYSDLMGRRMVVSGNHFLMIDEGSRTIYHETRTSPQHASAVDWNELEKQVRASAQKFRIIASDTRTITLSAIGEDEGVASMEMVLGLADHLPIRVTYRMKEPLEDGNDRIEVSYRFLPPDPALIKEYLSLGRYLRKRPDGTYEVSPAFKSFRLIEPDRS